MKTVFVTERKRCRNFRFKAHLHWLKAEAKAKTSFDVSRFYRPQRSCEGYVFTPVCQSFCSRGGVCLSACWDTTPPRTRHPRCRHPPEQTPPRTRHPPRSRHPPGTRHHHPGAGTPQRTPLGPGTPQQMATVADGTHPTGMHSCFFDLFM